MKLVKEEVCLVVTHADIVPGVLPFAAMTSVLQGLVSRALFVVVGLSQYKLLLEVARLVSLKKQIMFYKWWQGRVLLSYRGWSKSLTRPGGASSLEKGTPRVTCMICPESGHPPGSKVVNRSPVTSLWEVERATCCAEQAPGRPVIPGQVPPSSQSEEASLQPTGTLCSYFDGVTLCCLEHLIFRNQCLSGLKK